MEAMFSRGALRIGTLFGWRESGVHGDRVGDISDGIFTVNGNLIFDDYTAIPYVIIDSDPVTVTGSGANELRHSRNTAMRCENVLTFCTALNYSAREHERMHSSEKYDSCYKIEDLPAFYDAIAQSAGMKDCEFVRAAGALYYDSEESNNDFRGRVFHPALFKNKGDYSDQSEFRGIWKPRTPSPEPLMFRDIEVTGIGSLCVEHASLKPICL